MGLLSKSTWRLMFPGSSFVDFLQYGTVLEKSFCYWVLQIKQFINCTDHAKTFSGTISHAQIPVKPLLSIKILSCFWTGQGKRKISFLSLLCWSWYHLPRRDSSAGLLQQQLPKESFRRKDCSLWRFFCSGACFIIDRIQCICPPATRLVFPRHIFFRGCWV